MAKLENVKILDMVNGEPTRVEYNGAIYEKTTDKAKAGDLVRVIDAEYITDVTQGGFYEMDDDTTFYDDDDCMRDYAVNDHALETFRKTSDDLAERLAELERRLEALEERMEEATEAESVPKFEVGDYVVALPESDEEYAITNTDMKLGKVIHVYGDGDIKIEIIAHEDDTEIGEEYRVEPKYFRKATAEEVEKKDEIARWAKIGRKPGEFKKGDIVRYKKATTEVISVKGDTVTINQPTYGGTFHSTKNDNLTLIVPVEQRFDLETEGVRQ